MPKTRAEIPHLEEKVKNGRKKFVRYDEAVELYSMCDKSVRKYAKEAGATYKMGRLVLINTELFEEFLEIFRER